jgi:tRNA dimethylallyltransferase
MNVNPTHCKLVVIVGETASGKSALAMDIARRFNGEIICADAMTVYQGFDIGTAKPSENDQAEVPHHMLDVASPTTGFNAAQFKTRAEQAIHAISARGKLPVLVGGSGLYVDSVLYDYAFLPSPNIGERDVLNTMKLADLLMLAHDRGLDTSGIDTANKRRVIRLIENGGAVAQRAPLRPQTCIIGLRTERDSLESQVKKRVTAMFEAGLEEEVRSLAGRYGWDAEPMRSIGYREWREYFAGQADLHETQEQIVRSTMQLAKKQRTWFKRNISIQWVHDPSNAVDIVTTFLNN